jgi:hypothetical protein
MMDAKLQAKAIAIMNVALAKTFMQLPEKLETAGLREVDGKPVDQWLYDQFYGQLSVELVAEEDKNPRLAALCQEYADGILSGSNSSDFPP